MTHSITLDLDSAEYAELVRAAAETGSDPSAHALALVRRGLPGLAADIEERKRSQLKALANLEALGAKLAGRGVQISAAELIRQVRDEAEDRLPVNDRDS